MTCGTAMKIIVDRLASIAIFKNSRETNTSRIHKNNQMECVELKNTLSEIYCMRVIAGAHCKRKDQ